MATDTKDWRNDYNEFRKQAAANGLSDVTEEEYNASVKGRATSLMSSFARVRNDRKGLKATYDRNILIGFPLGDADATNRTTKLESVKMTKVAFFKPTGEFMELTSWGTFSGHHGKKAEIELEHQIRSVKGKDYESDVVRKVTQSDESVNINTLLKRAKGAYDITEDDKYKICAVVGVIQERGWEYAPIFDVEDSSGGPSSYHPLIVNDKPAVQFMIHANPAFRIQIGPSRLSDQLIKLEGFVELARSQGGLDELCKSFSNLPCLFIGRVQSIKPKESNTYIGFQAMAVFEITDQQFQDVMSKSANKAMTNPAKATAELSSAVVQGLISVGDTGLGIDMAALKTAVSSKFGEKAGPLLEKYIKVMVAKGTARVDGGRIFKLTAQKALDQPQTKIEEVKAEEKKPEVVEKVVEKKVEPPTPAPAPPAAPVSVSIDVAKQAVADLDMEYEALQRMVYKAFMALGDDLHGINFLTFAKSQGFDTSKLSAVYVDPIIAQVKAGVIAFADMKDAAVEPKKEKKVPPKKEEKIPDLGAKKEKNKAALLDSIQKLERKVGTQVRFADVTKELVAIGLNHSEIEESLNALIDSADVYETTIGWIARVV